MQGTVEANAKSGVYSKITDGESFAGRLTRDLQDVSKDRHVFVNYVSEPQKVEAIRHIDSVYAPSEAIPEIERNARQKTTERQKFAFSMATSDTSGSRCSGRWSSLRQSMRRPCAISQTPMR